MAIKTVCEKKAANILKAELKRRGVGYGDLQLALEKIGIKKTTHNIAKTINMGKFSFAFFLQCLKAIEIEKLSLDLTLE